nr:sterile alpha motif domain-containing protein 9-like isoform X2 [Paramormyrops kingsleyae]
MKLMPSTALRRGVHLGCLATILTMSHGEPQRVWLNISGSHRKGYRQALHSECFPDRENCLTMDEQSLPEGETEEMSIREGQSNQSHRFLLCGNGEKVLLSKKVEANLDALSILCVNECEGGNLNKHEIEEHFYKGGKVSWWNFYFSEEPGSTSLIKRDKYDVIRNVIIPNLCNLNVACVSFNLFHLPGCGGTTLAMHVLWSLKDTFRCAVLKEGSSDLAVVASQVVQLLTYGAVEQSAQLPVLLMLDDFEEKDSVFDLKQHIVKEMEKKNLSSQCPQVILLNCMRIESMENTDLTEDTVLIGNNLSAPEQKCFQEKLREVDEVHKQDLETFYGFMVMKKNFLPEYIQGVARNVLKSFDFEDKHAELLAVLFLLNTYCKGAYLSVSLCEEFLGIKTKPYCGSNKVEDAFGKFSTLVTQCRVKDNVDYDALKIIHPSMAESCLQELVASKKAAKAEITNLLLMENKFFTCVQGKTKLWEDVHSILVKRDMKCGGENNRFSPLVQDIIKESPGAIEIVLFNAVERFTDNAVMFQLLARYHYLVKKNFRQAEQCAWQAQELSPKNSYISDTCAQVIKHELKFELKRDLIPDTPGGLDEYLRMAHSATDAFRETQEIAKKEDKRDNTPYNSAGHLGEIQVAVMILEILQSQLNSDQYNTMKCFLNGSIKTHDFLKIHPFKHSAGYCSVVQQYSNILCNLQHNMKRQFDFFNSFFVHLTARTSSKEQIQSELARCFSFYVDVFCNISTQLNDLSSNWQFLESKNADTYSGLLNFLSNNIESNEMEEIVEKYAFIIENSTGGSNGVKERINFIYANIVLYCIKPESRSIRPFESLQKTLSEVLTHPATFKDSMELHFIAVALLWPQLSVPKFSERLGTYVSQMSRSFQKELGAVCHAKWPVVHFYLGKEKGYGSLVSQENMSKSVGSEANISSLFQNGKLWNEEAVRQQLCRVTGRVEKDALLADTSKADFNIEVKPFYKRQLSSQVGKVSFLLGFTMKGPLAFDIQLK